MIWVSRVKGWLAAAALFILALAGVWFKGRQGGKAAARQEAQEDALEQAAEATQEIQEVKSEVRQMPAGGASDRLKRDWVRKP